MLSHFGPNSISLKHPSKSNRGSDSLVVHTVLIAVLHIAMCVLFVLPAGHARTSLGRGSLGNRWLHWPRSQVMRCGNLKPTVYPVDNADCVTTHSQFGLPIHASTHVYIWAKLCIWIHEAREFDILLLSVSLDLSQWHSALLVRIWVTAFTVHPSHSSHQSHHRTPPKLFGNIMNNAWNA